MLLSNDGTSLLIKVGIEVCLLEIIPRRFLMIIFEKKLRTFYVDDRSAPSKQKAEV